MLLVLFHCAVCSSSAVVLTDSNTYLHDTLRVFCADPAPAAVLTDHIDFSVPGSLLVLTL